jgi:hypothetical protein
VCPGAGIQEEKKKLIPGFSGIPWISAEMWTCRNYVNTYEYTSLKSRFAD